MYLFFWYCIDDYVARMTENPDLGTVPWWVVLVAAILLSGVHVKATINK